MAGRAATMTSDEMDEAGSGACSHAARCGVNVSGDGEPVGLWFEPDMVELDEHAYVAMGPEDLAALGLEMVRSVGAPGPETVTVAVYSDGDVHRAFVAANRALLHEQLAAEIVAAWLTAHQDEAEESGVVQDAAAFLAAGDDANAVRCWGEYQSEKDTGEWIEILTDVAVYGRRPGT